MENLFANIIVNISHEDLDKTFQYKVPEDLKESIGVGCLVRIPFGRGNKEISGYVLEITDKAEYDVSKLKEIICLVNDNSLVESKLIRLAYWMKNNYGSTMINALKTVIPLKRKIKEKQERSIVLKLEDERARQRLLLYEKKHNTARARVMRELLSEGELDYSLVVNKLNVTAKTLKYMEEQGDLSVETRRVYRNSASGIKEKNKDKLNEEQRAIAGDILRNYREGRRDTCLIRGITGSGKTEIYMELIEAIVAEGRQAIVLIPEISLTYQTVMRFYKRFGDRVSTLHSKLSAGERYDQFERARNGKIDVMIGPRSALFTPFSDLGLIIIDEEHENSYKSDNMPKYHARETAIELAGLHGAFVVLGSATPSLDAFYKAKTGEYRLYELDKRANGAKLPMVTIADLRQELKQGNRSVFSNVLREKINDRLDKREQIMLFLNRRGYAGFVSCRTCGHVIKCPHCDVALSEHRGGKLICHYCGHEQGLVRICPECGSSYIGGMRAGTEAVEQNIRKDFPQATVLRMDADTTKSKDSYENILSAFANGEADILVGTQMIVKGHDFPNVTLVGVLAADMSLYANDYRAAERTFQLLTQAAGRAGRAGLMGEVVIQTYSPDNYAILAAGKQDYNLFYNEEIMYRSMLSYPPCGHMLAVLTESADESSCRRYADALAGRLKNDIIAWPDKNRPRVIGPTDATIKKLNDVYRRMFYIRSDEYRLLTSCKDRLEALVNANKRKDIRVSFDFDPMNGY